MDELKKYLGPLAVVSVIGYMALSKKSETENPMLEGINIDIDADKIVDSLKTKINTNPQAQKAIGHALKGLISGYLSSLNEEDSDGES